MTARRSCLAPGQLSILVLDDDPQRHAEFARQGRGHWIDHCWFVDDAISRLRQWRYDLVCLDNDLGTEAFEREGFEVASYIAEMPTEALPRAVLVHSWNGRRAIDMESSLQHRFECGVTLERAEFGSFSLVAPGPTCTARADLRSWIERFEAQVEDALSDLLKSGPASSGLIERM